MKKIISFKETKKVVGIITLFLFCCLTSMAQNPSWAKKASQAVFTLKTFNNDGSLIGSSNGFFIGNDGEALSCFAPFKGAQRAVVIDAQGKEWPVECLLGANDMYDVAKFKVSVKKPVTLALSSSATNGAVAWLLPYSAKKSPDCQRGSVTSSEKFQGDYSYYTLAMQASEQHSGCPVLDENGQVLGLLQPSSVTSSASAYAVSAVFANDLCISGLSMNDPAFRSTHITIALPDQHDEALLTLLMAASADEVQYQDVIDRFIQKFPQSADGYIYRARNEVAKGDFAAANNDIRQALKVGQQKDDTHFQVAQMIYQKEIYQADQPYPDWNLDLALKESREAYRINPQPVYRQQQAQILYAQQKYDEAGSIYEELAKGPLRNADTFYAAAQCKLQQDNKKEALILLDSAVSMFTRPYIKTAAPYLHARAQLSMEFRRFQQAINDMQDLVALEPTDVDLWAEKASFELRLNLFDQAFESATQCISLAPDVSDGYLMAGIAQCAKGDKKQGLQNLDKAKELGNSQAQKFIDKYK